MLQKLVQLLPKSLLARLRAWRAASRQSKFAGLSMEQTFTRIFETNHWNGKHSHSGTGSDPENTQSLNGILEQVVSSHGIQSLYDCPCGDFFWMKNVVSPLGVHYVGADVVPAIVEQNKQTFSSERIRFVLKDMSVNSWEKADLALCRDGLVHLSFQDAMKAIENLKASGTTWLLITTFPEHKVNYDITTGEWRSLNMQLPPFAFPEPVALFLEKPVDGNGEYNDKSLGLWRVSDLGR